MSGLLQHHHDRGHLHERQEVGRLLLVPRRHPSELLGLRPEPLGDVALPVQVPVDLPLLLAIPLRRKDRLGAAPAHLVDERPLVGAAVSASFGFRAVFIVTAGVVLFNAVYSWFSLSRTLRPVAE